MTTSAKRIIYVDHNATTPMHSDAIKAMADAQRNAYGNASSVHSRGADARVRLESARKTIADMIGCKSKELYFTSGGTEANNWAIRGVIRGDQRQCWGIVTSAVEHKSVLGMARYWGLSAEIYNTIKVDEDGVVDLEHLETCLPRPRGSNRYLVSVMLANNETGTIQPVRDVVDIVKELWPGSLVHTDAVQAFGKMPVNVKELGVDLMTISAHKIGGPKGIGALYVREGVKIAPSILGGHQERDYRAGTENVAAAVGFQVAASRRKRKQFEYWDVTLHCTKELERLLHEGLNGLTLNGRRWFPGSLRKRPGQPPPCSGRICNTLNIGFAGVQSDALVLMLSNAGVFVSNGSACESGSLAGSHVLQAMGRTDAESRNAIRFSFSDDLEAGDVKIIADAVIEAVNALRSMGDVPF